MYCTSTQLKLFSEQELIPPDVQSRLKLPQPYCDFMKTYGDGTYGGVICINCPDFQLLKEYAAYDFWEHENAPITKAQTAECIVIGNSIDGDYIALHPDRDGYILLPRHSDIISFFPFHDEPFLDTIRKISDLLYAEPWKDYDYFEPAGAHYLFLHKYKSDLHKMAKQFQAAFDYDYLIEDEYTCKVFLLRMGGYIRFNFSCSEIAIFYFDYGLASFQETKNFLMERGYN